MLDNNLNLIHSSILILEIDYPLTEKNIVQIIFDNQIHHVYIHYKQKII